MGYMSALDVALNSEDLHVGIGWHFVANCYPPVSNALVDSAALAVLAVIDGNVDEMIELPEGFRHPTGEQSVSAATFVEDQNLQAFVDAALVHGVSF